MMGESAPQGEFSIFTESHRIEKKDDPLKKNIDITTSQPVEMTNTKQSVTLTEDRPRENSKLIMMGTPLELNCFLYENQQVRYIFSISNFTYIKNQFQLFHYILVDFIVLFACYISWFTGFLFMISFIWRFCDYYFFSP